MGNIFKVWFATVLISPIVICIVLGFMQGDVFSILELYFPMVIIGTIFSFPTILIQALAIAGMKRAGLNSITIKLVLSLLAVAGTIISFYITEVSFIKYLGPCVYSAIMVGFIWYFKLPDGKKDIEISSHN